MIIIEEFRDKYRVLEYAERLRTRRGYKYNSGTQFKEFAAVNEMFLTPEEFYLYLENLIQTEKYKRKDL